MCPDATFLQNRVLQHLQIGYPPSDRWLIWKSRLVLHGITLLNWIAHGLASSISENWWTLRCHDSHLGKQVKPVQVPKLTRQYRRDTLLVLPSTYSYPYDFALYHEPPPVSYKYLISIFLNSHPLLPLPLHSTTPPLTFPFPHPLFFYSSPSYPPLSDQPLFLSFFD